MKKNIVRLTVIPFCLFCIIFGSLTSFASSRSNASENTITDVSQTSIRTSLNLEQNSIVSAVVYNADGKMLEIASEELSAGTYTNHDFSFLQHLSQGNTVRLLTTSLNHYTPIKDAPEITVWGSLPEKLYKVYFELENGHLYARLNSQYDTMKENCVHMYFVYNGSGCGNSYDYSTYDGDVKEDLTNHSAYNFPTCITSLTITHSIDGDEVASASASVSISSVEGNGTPINITDIQAQIEGNYIKYIFTVDQELDSSQTYAITYQNDTIHSHSNKLGYASVKDGKLICYKSVSSTFPGTGHFYVTYAESIVMNGENDYTISYLPKGNGYQFDNDSITYD